MGKHLAGVLGATFIAAASSGVVLACAPTAEAKPSASERPSASAGQESESTKTSDDTTTAKGLKPKDSDNATKVEEDSVESESETVEIDVEPGVEEGDGEEDLVDVVGSVVLAGSARDPETAEEPTARDAATVEVADPPQPVITEEAEFTGRPSLIGTIFTSVLRTIKPVLQAFGIELNGTSARIPFFTDGVPPFFVRSGLTVTSGEYNGWKTWTLAPRRNPTDEVVVAVHGGSFISTASLFHWSTYASLARRTGVTVVVPLYALANAEGTGGTANTVVPVMADFIAEQVAAHGKDNVAVLGDSAGGSIALAASQVLAARCEGEQECLDGSLPGRMVLLSPALDASASNPNIALVDDPLLSPASSKRNGQWWAKGLESEEDPDGTHHPLASPIYGSLEHLPPTTVYAGSLDLRTPDVLVLQQKAIAAGADFEFRLRNRQIHDWMIFGFLPDAVRERGDLISDLGM